MTFSCGVKFLRKSMFPNISSDFLTKPPSCYIWILEPLLNACLCLLISTSIIRSPHGSRCEILPHKSGYVIFYVKNLSPAFHCLKIKPKLIPTAWRQYRGGPCRLLLPLPLPLTHSTAARGSLSDPHAHPAFHFLFVIFPPVLVSPLWNNVNLYLLVTVSSLSKFLIRLFPTPRSIGYLWSPCILLIVFTVCVCVCLPSI